MTNVNDSGAGSFRQAINDANAGGGSDTIVFQIPGSAPFTINVLSALPALSKSMTIDATTQPGYSAVNRPVVELNGTSAGSSTGLRVAVAGAGARCTIRGLAINRFGAHGIQLDSTNNVIQGNYIGTDVTGTIARGNTMTGIYIFGTAGNLIGGTNAANRNLISGLNDTGIYILNPTASGNVVQGNYIGVNAAGTADLGNLNNGIAIYSAPSNTIGGPVAGARNLISGNDGSGINLNGSSASGNVVQGNYIGVNAAGTAGLSNVADGITLNSAPNTQIGGTNAGAGNLISGNGKAGIFLNGAGASGNRMEGNFIGTDVTGLLALGNVKAGVTMSGAVSNTIGGTVPAARNVISGNREHGIAAGASSVGNRFQGNYIGVTVAGTAALSNAFTGVALDSSSFNLISGDPAGVRSVISGNGDIGVWIKGAGAKSNTVTGNFIGTAVGGTNAVGNAHDGVRITDGSYNQLGGLTVGERNILSGNGFVVGEGAGLLLEGSSASGNVVQGNFLGSDVNGQNALANRTEGIFMDAARNNSIGGDVAGAGNLISGNTTRGIHLTNSWGNAIRGNLIGTRADGTTSLANGQFNVEIEENSISNSIGGLTIGAGNRIAFSGGGFAAVRVRALCTNDSILGNAIFSNSGLGIDLGDSGLGQNGVTPNDNCDGDSGANQLQNFPVLVQAYGGASAGVRGYLNSAAGRTYRLQFFSSVSCDASGNGEGQVFLGDTLVTTGGSCSNGFVVTLPVSVTPGNVVTATATDPANNTSEFSACLPVLPAPRLGLAPAGGNQVSLAWTNTAPGFVLKETTNLAPTIVWSTVTNVPVISNGQFGVTLGLKAGNRFYRLNFE